ncbi:MAG: N-acetylmuramic acid 6-phosphate etherase [bacterium]|nr:N-acetylmuramic acid 6-phosphate etherase [bacterium]
MAAYDDLIQQLRQLGTEQINPHTREIDRLSALEIVAKINDEDATVAGVVRRALPEIARTAELYAETLRSGGRVFYVGAGTSGRLGVLDAAECPPTFGTDPDQIRGIISGGFETLVLSKEGVEDDREAARTDLTHQQLCSKDMVIGIAASRRTPYTLSALEFAKSLGCRTAFIICNEPGSLELQTDILIALPVGPEVITGSTRMKSGTAQKMTLNMISTTAMVLLGKTYGNLMVDLQSRSEKLAARSRRILMDLLQMSLEEADHALQLSGGSVKIAIVMKRCACSREEAVNRLNQANGFISRIVG